MARHKKTLICTLLLVVLLLSTALPALAASTTAVMYLPSLCQWASTPVVTRSGSHGSLNTYVGSVYPAAGGTDTLTTVVCRVYDSSFQNIVTRKSQYTFVEGVPLPANTDDHDFWIKDGYFLTYYDLVFQYRSVTQDAARAVITYDAK